MTSRDLTRLSARLDPQRAYQESERTLAAQDERLRRQRPMPFLLTTTTEAPCDLHLADFGDVESWCDALADLDGDPIRLDLRLDGPNGITTVAAFAHVVRVLETQSAAITCVVVNQRSIDHLTRLLPEAQRPRDEIHINGARILLTLSNLMQIHADAVVNASNMELTLGGGVSGAIRHACADPIALQRAMHALAPIAKGETVVTPAFGLPNVRWILHTATARGGLPVVEDAFRTVLQVAQSRSLRSLALPALGTGTGRVPARHCGTAARQAFEALRFEGVATFAFLDASTYRQFKSGVWPP
jgi:O-acetyl-ADP-ribose deacetylase (regulator of RNase III)